MIRRLSMLLVLVGCLAALVASPAGAARGAAHVSGTYTAVDFGTTACERLDDARVSCTTTGLTSDYDGDLDGLSTASFRQVIDCARGRTVGEGSETFTGTIGGEAGTLTWQLWFTSDFDCSSFLPSNLRIVAVPTQGGGGLAGLRGVLLFGDTDYRGVLG
jgi:Protein of unknown function (DUF3224)